MVSLGKKECCECNTQFLLPVKHYPLGYPREETGYVLDDPKSLRVDGATGKRGSEYLVNCALFLAVVAPFLGLVWFSERQSMYIYSDEFPVFRIDDFFVYEFHPPSPGISSARWEINVTVKNPDTGLKAFLQEMEGFIYYREDNLFSDRIASATSPLFITMESGTRSIMHMKLQANHTDIAMLDGSIVNKMGKDKINGTVHFNLHFKILTAFDNQQRWPWKRQETKEVNAYCNDIKVSFDGASGNGHAASRDLRNGPLFCQKYHKYAP